MAQYPGKKMIAVYIEESIHREIRVYSAETGRTMMDIVKPLAEQFEQSAIGLVTQIREMRKEAETKRQILEEEAKIVAENPVVVAGHQVDPLESLQVNAQIQI